MSAGEAPGAPRRRVLLVEDETVIAMLVEDMLLDIDLEVAEVAARLEPAMRAAETGNFDCAVLDLNLGGQLTYPVADLLKARGIPFAFITGYGTAGLAPPYATCPVLQKPFRSAELTAIVMQLLEPGPG